jgi:hypothetical protein
MPLTAHKPVKPCTACENPFMGAHAGLLYASPDAQDLYITMEYFCYLGVFSVGLLDYNVDLKPRVKISQRGLADVPSLLS